MRQIDIKNKTTDISTMDELDPKKVNVNADFRRMPPETAEEQAARHQEDIEKIKKSFELTEELIRQGKNPADTYPILRHYGED